MKKFDGKYTSAFGIVFIILVIMAVDLFFFTDTKALYSLPYYLMMTPEKKKKRGNLRISQNNSKIRIKRKVKNKRKAY